MATTTTNYGFDIPQSTDLVKDGATAIATLGQDIDTAMNTALGTKKAGMVLLNTTSFSGVASHSVSNFVSATYSNYKIVTRIAGSAGLVCNFKFRENVTDKSTNYYGASWFYRFDSTSGIGAARNNGTEAVIGATKSGGNCVSEFLYTVTSSGADGFILGSSFDDNSTGGWTFAYKCGATNITGFTLLASSGNITGEVSVYGFNK